MISSINLLHLPLISRALFEIVMRLIILLSIFTTVVFSGCLDLGNEGESESIESPGGSAFDRKQKLKELELQIESLKWENSRLSLKVRTVKGSALVLDKKTGLWHHDVERDPYTGTASELFINGSPRGEAGFINGRKDGMERFWWANGKLKDEGQWFDGMKNGIFKEWNSKGHLIQVFRFKKDQLIEVILDQQEKNHN